MQKGELEQQKGELEQQKGELEQQLHNAVISLHKKGQTAEQIAILFAISVDEVQRIIN